MAFAWWTRLKEGLAEKIAEALPRVGVGEVGAIYKAPFGLPRFLRDMMVGAFARERQASFPATRTFTHTEWDAQRIDVPLSEVSPLKNQMIQGDGTLIGPDGQFIRITVTLPTGTMYNDQKFKSRMAAQLKQLEEQGKVEPIQDASNYIKKSVIDMDFYLTTISGRITS